MGTMYSADSLSATVLQPDGETLPFVLPEHESERLERLQELVGGHLEVVAIRGGRYMVGCETAKDVPHVINRVATAIAHDSEAIQAQDYLAGTFVIVTHEALA